MSNTQPASVSPVLIRGGTVVNADGERRADVLCVDGRIAAVGADLQDHIDYVSSWETRSTDPLGDDDREFL